MASAVESPTSPQPSPPPGAERELHGARPSITLGALFLAFLEVSMLGFGGPIVWARRIIVQRRGWLSDPEFADILSLC